LAVDTWFERPEDLKKKDKECELDPEWFMNENMLGAVCYVDRYA